MQKTHFSSDEAAFGKFIRLLIFAIFLLNSLSFTSPAQSRFSTNISPALQTSQPTGAATVGSLDPTFNGSGLRVDGFGYGRDETFAAAIQPDGKIVVAGRSFFGSRAYASAARYNPNGSLDTSFNGSGFVWLLNKLANAYAVRVQSDGKIVIAGNVFTGQFSDFAVVRLNSDGTIDNSFDGDGVATTTIAPRSDTVYGLAIQADGKIVAVGVAENPNLSGFNEFALARYNADGSPDAQFGFGGKMTTLLANSSEARAVVVQPDGRIVVAGSGSSAVVARYGANGFLDTTFDGDGTASIPFHRFNAVALQSDNKIVAAGSPGTGSIDFAVTRFNADGSLDTTFDGDGTATAPGNLSSETAFGVAVDAQGKITAVGGDNTSEFIAVRFNANGGVDTDFGTGGRAAASFSGQKSYVKAAALQADGKIVAVGNVETTGSSADFALVRFNGDGSADTTFDTDGMVRNNFGDAALFTGAVAVQSDGKIVTVGRNLVPGSLSDNWNYAVFRYNADGSLDSTFDGDGKTSIGFFDNIDDFANSIVIQPDGKIIVAGYLNNGSFTSFSLVRLLPNGSLDETFDGDGKVFTDVSPDQDFGYSVALAANGKIVVGGISGSGSTFDFSVARYNANGSLDTSFNGTGKAVTPVGTADDQVYETLVQPDGKIILAGHSTVGGNANFSMIRYNEDGSLDSTFGSGGKVFTAAGTASSAAYAAALQRDGKIVLGGGAFSPNFDFALVRYNSDGTLDTSFGTNGIVNTSFSLSDQINSLVIQPDGKIIAAGESTALGTVGLDFALARYHPNGSLDTTWNGTGKVTTNVSGVEDRAIGVALSPSGSVVAAGRAGGLSGIARYVGDSPLSARKTPFDFDGDSKTDLAVFRPSAGEWWINRSSSGATVAAQFGASTDKPVPADFTGDGKTDVAFFRPASGEWFILRSEDGSFLSFPFGASSDVPVPGDFDGDGKADPTVYRPSTNEWFILRSTGGTAIVTFGAAGDVPVPADYDGDSKTDIAIFRPADGSWWYLRSSDNQFRVFRFGTSTDKPVQGDYTGDGRADIAVFRPSTGEWFFQRSEDNSYYSLPFGQAGDVPAPGDYDGDGRFDTAVFRPAGSNWYVNRSTAGLLIQQFGLPNDTPVPSVYIP